MSSYACKDSDRKEFVYASELKEINITKDKTYYCPNKDCNASLTLRSRNGLKNPYFAALPTHPHVAGCYVKAIGNNNDIQIDKNFSIDDFYESVINNSQRQEHNHGEPSHEPRPEPIQDDTNRNDMGLNTVSKLFYFCEQHELNFQINDEIKVNDIICDSRNNHLFTKFIKGKKIFLCNFSNKTEPNDKYNHHTYFFNYPTGEDADNKYTLIIKVTSSELAEKIDRKLEKYRNNSMVLMIDCNSKNKYIFGEIFNIKQLAIIK